MNVQVFVLSPPLEHAPDQIASRPLVTLNVIDVPVVNDAEPVLPTETLIPAGLERTRSPLRPLAVTVNVAVPPPPPLAAGVTVNAALRVAPPYAPETVTAVDVATASDVTVNVALVAPAGIVTLAGVVAAPVLLLDNVTTAPPDGAADVSVTVPCELALPPTTLDGLTASELNAGADVDDCTVKLRTDDQLPAVPALLRPRTRHQY